MRIGAFLMIGLFILVSCNTSEQDTTQLTENEIEVQAEETAVDALTLSFIDESWDGITVPEGQWCSTFDGEGSTPELLIENIPANTQVLSIAYSDRSFEANDNGGHGIVGIRLEDGSESIVIPSIPGESFDLPENMFIIEEARSSRSSGGAYLPPCSGGRENEYYITVNALDSESIDTANVLSSSDIEMGKY